ncbi:MAG: hypothetical protein FWG72_06425 [Oscillospiraceae bacterium]|nr:hypothetical protein [Oscillospiraceae bacterium]
MLTKDSFRKAALRLYDRCPYPAVRYKILFHFLDTPYEDDALCELRPQFLSSDIVEELWREQEYLGGWGPLESKDYSVKARFPTSLTAIKRCLYIGLTIEDRDILLRAYEYLEDFLTGRSRERLYNKNERAIPWQTASICEMLEAIKPYNELCDRTYGEWLYIASRAYEDGEYAYERERKAQHEIFYTRQDRLVPMQFGLLLKRRGELPPELKAAMLRHHGGHAARHGWFWDKTPDNLPENFVCDKSRRWFHTFNYINQFRGSALYLANAADWLMKNQNADGLWDWGPQTKDPWGYFGYFSTNRSYKHNRVTDCTVEVLSFLKTYIDNNES